MERELLVGTTDGIHRLGDRRHVSVEGREVRSLARGESGWWAILDGSEVWRSDAGADWVRVASVEELRANCLLPTPGGLYVGTSEARLVALEGKKFEPVGPFDRVEGREKWFTPWGGPPDVRSMSADPSGRVYVNVHVGGVVRSTDGGSSWEPTPRHKGRRS